MSDSKKIIVDGKEISKNELVQLTENKKVKLSKISEDNESVHYKKLELLKG